MTDPVRPVAPRIDRVLQRVAELPDRTSPDDWPEAMLVTAEELRGILESELAAAPVSCAASPADPWQPIETAPKDRRQILIATADGTVGEAWYYGWSVNDTKSDEGWWWAGTFPGEYSDERIYAEVTHWMPLPTPPRATGEGARDEEARDRDALGMRPVSDGRESADAGRRGRVDGDSVDRRGSPPHGQDVPQSDIEAARQVDASAAPQAQSAPVAVSLGLPEALAAFIDIYGVVFDEDDVVMLQAVLARLRGEATVRPEVNRFEVIDETGRLLTRRIVNVELSYQDDGRTLKVFLKRAQATVRVEE